MKNLTPAQLKNWVNTLSDGVIDSASIHENDGVDIIAGVIANLAQYLADTINPR